MRTGTLGKLSRLKKTNVEKQNWVKDTSKLCDDDNGNMVTLILEVFNPYEDIGTQNHILTGYEIKAPYWHELKVSQQTYVWMWTFYLLNFLKFTPFIIEFVKSLWWI